MTFAQRATLHTNRSYTINHPEVESYMKGNSLFYLIVLRPVAPKLESTFVSACLDSTCQNLGRGFFLRLSYETVVNCPKRDRQKGSSDVVNRRKRKVKENDEGLQRMQSHIP